MKNGSRKKLKFFKIIFKTFLEMNDNKNTLYLSVWYTMKEVLRGKFSALNFYIKKWRDFISLI